MQTKEGRLTRARCNSDALDIYRKWFAAENPAFSGRVFRLSADFQFSHTLKSIPDVNFSFFKKRLYEAENSSELQAIGMQERQIDCNAKERKKRAHDFIAAHSDTDEWLHSLFPAEYLAWKRTVEGKREKRAALEEKNSEFLARLLGAQCHTQK